MASPISSATRTASSKDASLARDDDAKLVPPSRRMFIKKTEVSPRLSLAPPLLPQHRRELQPCAFWAAPHLSLPLRPPAPSDAAHRRPPPPPPLTPAPARPRRSSATTVHLPRTPWEA